MVAVTKRGVVKNVRRVRQAARTRVVSPSKVLAPSTATIALPGSLKLEDFPQVGRKHIYVVSDAMWDHLLSTGWQVKEYVFSAAYRVLDRDGDDFELRDIGLFSRDAVLERRRYFGVREYVDRVIVRVPWSDSISSEGWVWYSCDES